jgi:iron(III) transport system substrate-binding protein
MSVIYKSLWPLLVSFSLILFPSLAGADEVGADLDAIVAAAKKEGGVVWYTNPGSRDTLAEPLRKWAELYPEIPLEIVETPGPTAVERVKAEQASGRVVADVLTVGDASMYVEAAATFQAIRTEALPNVARISPRLSAFVDKDKHYLPTTLYVYGIGVNTAKLGDGERPKSWADLVSGKFEGIIGLHDFSHRGGGATLVIVGREVLGDEFFHKLYDQNVRLYARAEELDASIVRGERAIAVPSRSRLRFSYPDTPIEWVQPEDGVYFVVLQSGIVNSAPHPNAAHLFLNFLLGEESQKAFAAIGDSPVVSGIPGQVDLETSRFLGAGALLPDEVSKLNSALEFGNSVLKR